jgi:hypothetical protein
MRSVAAIDFDATFPALGSEFAPSNDDATGVR